jgi:hypothetical protein
MSDLSPQTRRLLHVLRAALISALGAIDDLLGLPRTIPPRSERKRVPDGEEKSEQSCYNGCDN